MIRFSKNKFSGVEFEFEVKALREKSSQNRIRTYCIDNSLG